LAVNKNYATAAVAEVTFTVLLAAARKRGELFSGIPAPIGFGLNGKRMAIIGHGRIGGAVQFLALAFGMEVIFVDARRDGGPALGTSYDFISINVPKSAGAVLDARLLGGRPRVIINPSGWENVDVESLHDYLVRDKEALYLHLAFPDERHGWKFAGLENAVIYPVFTSKHECSTPAELGSDPQVDFLMTS
jgi:hypothetical protein